MPRESTQCPQAPPVARTAPYVAAHAGLPRVCVVCPRSQGIPPQAPPAVWGWQPRRRFRCLPVIEECKEPQASPNPCAAEKYRVLLKRIAQALEQDRVVRAHLAPAKLLHHGGTPLPACLREQELVALQLQAAFCDSNGVAMSRHAHPAVTDEQFRRLFKVRRAPRAKAPLDQSNRVELPSQLPKPESGSEISNPRI